MAALGAKGRTTCSGTGRSGWGPLARSPIARRSALGLLGALALVALWGGPVYAQGAQGFEASSALYGAHELQAGGRPLYARLFAQGWPTDRGYRRLTLETAGDTADRLFATYLASGVGLTLADSSYQRARHDEKVKAGERFATPSALLADELRLYRTLTGYQAQADSISPVVFPPERATAELSRTWSADDPRAWAWRRADGPIPVTLEGLGLALWGEASFAGAQLAEVRVDGETGGRESLLGPSAREGFFGLVALQAAAAKVHELRYRLLLDFQEGTIVPSPDLLSMSPRRYYFPAAFTATPSSSGADYRARDLDGGKLKSRLSGGAAVLLGLCELAALVGPDGPPSVRGLFSERTVMGRKVTVFDPGLHEQIVEVAVFTFEALRTLHVSVEGRGRASSLADPRLRGATITPTDLGLYLMAIEAFVNKVQLPADRNRGAQGPLAARLEDEQRKARTLIGSLSGMVLSWHQNQPGFYDSYDVSTSARASTTKSLASQAFAVRGLIATHRAVAGGAERSPFLKAAAEAVAWLDAELWSREVNAYAEVDSKGVRRAPLFGAVAVLGALREMALVTDDGRYLLRYRQYLETLHGRGLVREGEARIAPGLALEVTFADSK